MKRGKPPGYRENTAQLLAIGNHQELASLLYVSLSDLESLINKPSYREFRIKKKRHGERLIHNPSPMLKTVLKRLSFYLNAVYTTMRNDHAYGFVPNIDKEDKQKNILENAKRHIGKNHLYSLDLKEFFPTISARRVYQIFSEEPFRFKKEIAAALALLSTYRRSLPMGANTSPIISNFACLEMDADLAKLSKNSDLEYTRYADDLTFSSDLPFTSQLKADIREILERQGFKVNERKVRERSRHRRQVVTGIKVNEKPNVDRTYIRNLRALLHDWRLNGLKEAVRHHFDLPGLPTYGQVGLFLASTEGKISFVGFVRGREDGVYLKLSGEFRELRIRKEG